MKHLKTAYPSEKPYFDKSGNLWLPTDAKFGGQLNPKLTPREWLTLQWLETQNKEYGSEKLKNAWCGSRTTYWRTRKSLKEKGYVYKEVR